MLAPNPTPIYHITNFENISRILTAGGLYSYNEMGQRSIVYTNMAHATIQGRRASHRVPYRPGGTLHDYVPFYFAPKSPMLYTINKGNVEGYENGQKLVVHLVTLAQEVDRCGVDWLFTDGHAVMMFSNFFNNFDHLDDIDWEIMNSRYWNDTSHDPDRKRRRQAEFLAHRFVPWTIIQEIGVMDNEVAQRVTDIINNHSLNTPVRVRRDWYY